MVTYLIVNTLGDHLKLLDLTLYQRMKNLMKHVINVDY